MDRIGFHNDVEYALISKSQGRVVIEEPIGYDKGNGNIYERDSKSKGFIVKKSDSLQFYGKGFDALLTQTSTKGISEDMALEKIEKDRTRLDEEWRTFPLNYLDLGTLEEEEKDGGTGVATVKTTEGGIKKIVDSKYSDELDLTAVTDIDGGEIPPLSTETILLEPKELLLVSEMEVEDGTEIAAVVSGPDGLNARSIPFKFKTNSDQDNLTNVPDVLLSAVSGDYTDLSSDKGPNVFLLASETDKIITLNGKVKVVQSGTPHPGSFTLDLITFSGGVDFTYKGKVNLDSCNPNVTGDICEFSFSNYKINVLAGESLAIATLSDTSDGIRFTVQETNITIRENSGQFETASNAKALTYKQALERLLYMVNGEPIEVRSDLLETGELSEDLITNGFWIRQFPDIIDEGTDEERKIQFKTSIGNLIEHLEALVPVAWWVEGNSNEEIFRIETLKYTQQNFIGVPFSKKSGSKQIYPQASKIKRKTLGDNFYSKIELGSQKGGDGYEEIHGLKSVSGRATFSTINKKNDSTYSKLSPYTLGDVDIELPRRKPYEFFSQEDTKYDSIISCIRAKNVGGKWYLKKWQDYFESAPTGVFSVNSAYNLELTPARILLNHGFMIKAGLYHHNDSNIVFAESNCNSSLITKKTGEDELRESPDKITGAGVIPVSRLENPRVRPKTVDLTLQVTQEIEDYITGKTDGVPNVFGLVAINTGQTIEYFRMIKTDANDEGKHKFVEAFIT